MEEIIVKGVPIASTIEPELQAALIETVSRTILSGGKKSEFKRAVIKNLFRQMGKAPSKWKEQRRREVYNLVDLLWKECLETIDNTASGKSE